MSFPGVGWQEIVLFLAVVVYFVFATGFRRRWGGVLVITTAVSIAATPADPASTLFATIILSSAFALGVLAAPYLSVPNESRR